jgi:hypothetical protein
MKIKPYQAHQDELQKFARGSWLSFMPETVMMMDDFTVIAMSFSPDSHDGNLLT